VETVDEQFCLRGWHWRVGAGGSWELGVHEGAEDGDAEDLPDLAERVVQGGDLQAGEHREAGAEATNQPPGLRGG
jgi:hypothetical protein